MLVRQPAWTLMSVLTLGTGIGLAATAFSIVYGSLYRGLPVEDSHALVHFERHNVSQGRELPVTPHDFEEWREHQRSFEDLAAYVEAVLTLTGDDGLPERTDGLRISANAFDILRTRAALGRVFTADEDRTGQPPVVLLGHHVWQNRYGADPAIVGRELRINGVPTTVVGVMPPGFAFPIAEQYWLPLRLDVSLSIRGTGRLDVFGRLRPGVNLSQARAELKAIGKGLEAAFPASNAGIAPILTPFTEEYVGDEFPRLVIAMLVGAGLVLLIACANVSSLVSARASRRAGELAIRGALGASRSQLGSQLLAETFLLSALGGAVGIVVALVGLAWFNDAWSRLGDLGLPHGPDGLFWWRFELDAVPLAFVLLVTLGSAFLTGLLPALYASRKDVNEVLQDESRGSVSRRAHRFGQVIVISEVAVTTGLLIAAGLTIQSLVNLTRADYGFTIDGVMTARIGLPDERYETTTQRRQFWELLTEQLRRTPGVIDAAAASALPMRMSRMTMVTLPGSEVLDDRDRPRVRTSTVGDGFFRIYDVRASEGRTFDSSDRLEGMPVAIVNESFARRHFSTESPLYRQIRVGHDDSDEPVRTIVGVVPDLWMEGTRDRRAEGVYLPLAQSRTPYGIGLRYLNVALRTTAEPEVMVAALRGIVSELDSDLPVYEIRTMEELIDDGTGHYRVYASFYSVAGGVALLLASLGLYGVLSFSVANASPEIGVRMALGAGRARVIRLYVGRGLKTVAVGICLGLLVAAWLRAELQRALFQVEGGATPIAIGVVLTLTVTSVLACYLPARRASRVSPTEAVRRA